MSNLRTMLTFCQGKGNVAQNVAQAVKIRADDQRDVAPVRAGVDFPDREELRTILDKAEGRWRPFIVTAIFTGMRASELRGLPWSNVDLDGAVIHVRQRADQWGTIGRPKSKAGNRDIPLAPMGANALRAWRDECPEGELGLVFPNGAGNVENHQNILDRFWYPLQLANRMAVDSGKRDAGNPVLEAKYGLHALRHAAASLFIAHLGWTPQRVRGGALVHSDDVRSVRTPVREPGGRPRGDEKARAGDRRRLATRRC